MAHFCVLHQYFEVERHKDNYLEVVVHLYCVTLKYHLVMCDFANSVKHCKTFKEHIAGDRETEPR